MPEETLQTQVVDRPRALGAGPAPAPVPDGSPEPLEARIVAATVACIAERGVARTTLDDVARAAGCGRATIYRTVAGGKDAVVARAAASELGRVLDQVRAAMAAAPTFEDAVVAGLHDGYRAVAAHPALRRVLAGEAELLMPHLSFQGLDRLLGLAGDMAGPPLGRFVDRATARAVGEWMARLVVGCAAGLAGAGSVNPAAGGCAADLADPAAVRRFVRTYLIPGVANAAVADTPQPAVPTASDPLQE